MADLPMVLEACCGHHPDTHRVDGRLPGRSRFAPCLAGLLSPRTTSSEWAKGPRGTTDPSGLDRDWRNISADSDGKGRKLRAEPVETGVQQAPQGLDVDAQ